MRKLLYFIMCIYSSVLAIAQDTTQQYKPFKIVISAGTTLNLEDMSFGPSPGFVFSIEPKYSISKRVTAGIVFQTAVVKYSGDDYTDYSDIGTVYGTMNYLLPRKKLTYFIGGGLGYVDSDMNYSGESFNHFAQMLQAGFYFRKLNVSGEYHFFKEPALSYFALKVGGLIRWKVKNK